MVNKIYRVQFQISTITKIFHTLLEYESNSNKRFRKQFANKMKKNFKNNIGYKEICIK